MEHEDSGAPSIPQLFLASFAASFIVFLAILLIFATLALFGSDPGSGFAILIYGGFYGMIITLGLSLVLIAPLGTAFALALRQFASPGPWHGSAIGTLMAVILGGMLLFQGGSEAYRDGGNFVVLAIFMAIAAGAGWIVQRYILQWPD